MIAFPNPHDEFYRRRHGCGQTTCKYWRSQFPPTRAQRFRPSRITTTQTRGFRNSKWPKMSGPGRAAPSKTFEQSYWPLWTKSLSQRSGHWTRGRPKRLQKLFRRWTCDSRYASYLSETGSRSRAGGFCYLGEDLASHNHGIGSLSQIIENVVSSAAESEYAALFKNGQRCCIFQNILADIGYPQSETPIVTDNTTARDTANRAIKSKRLQATAMRHHWIRDRVRQGRFQVIWEAGETNRADFFTKALPVKVHHF